MTIEVSWYSPPRIVYVHITGEPTVDEIKQFGETLHNMMQEGTPPIHILIEDTDGGKPPVSQLNELRETFSNALEDSFGWVVAVGETNDSVNFLMPMFMKILKIDFKRFNTREEALSFLQEQDTSLENL